MPSTKLAQLEIAKTEGRKLDKVTDVHGASEFLQETLGLTIEQLESCKDFNMGRLADLVAGVTGGTTTRSKRWLDQALNPYITRDQAAPTIRPS